MRDDLVHRLSDAGYDARVEVSLSPAWSTDWITRRGREALAAGYLDECGDVAFAGLIQHELLQRHDGAVQRGARFDGAG